MCVCSPCHIGFDIIEIECLVIIAAPNTADGPGVVSGRGFDETEASGIHADLGLAFCDPAFLPPGGDPGFHVPKPGCPCRNPLTVVVCFHRRVDSRVKMLVNMLTMYLVYRYISYV